MKKLFAVLITIMGCFCVVSVSAAPKAGNPGGGGSGTLSLESLKGEIDQLRADLELLSGRVGDLETIVNGYQTTIDSLEAQNAYLTPLVEQNVTDIATIKSEINALKQADQDNSDLIATLETALATATSDISNMKNPDIVGSLQEQINHNLSLINALDVEIIAVKNEYVKKEDQINGICPDGKSLLGIQDGGSLVCGSPPAYSNQLHSVLVSLCEDVVGGAGRAIIELSCPTGYTVTGVGHYNRKVNVYESRSTDSNTGLVIGENLTGSTQLMCNYTTCTGIVPETLP